MCPWRGCAFFCDRVVVLVVGGLLVEEAIEQGLSLEKTDGD